MTLGSFGERDLNNKYNFAVNTISNMPMIRRRNKDDVDFILAWFQAA